MLPNRVLVDCLCSLTKNSHDKIDGLWYFQRDATGFRMLPSDCQRRSAWLRMKNLESLTHRRPTELSERRRGMLVKGTSATGIA